MITATTILLLTQVSPNTQKDIAALYAQWDKAVVAHNRNVMDSIIAPKFSAKIKGTKKTLSKAEFLNGITAGWSKKDSPKDLSFNTKISKIMEVNANYAVYIEESKVVVLKDGSKRKASWKSLDTWAKVGKTWRIVATEPMDK
jgi:hypothetical protein